MREKEYLTNAPLSGELTMENPTGYYRTPSGTSYIIDSGGMSVLAVDENWNYQYTITGGVENNSFYYAAELAADKQGNLYILDYVNSVENGTAVSERIVKYDENGNFVEFLYQNNDGEGRNLRGLTMIEDQLVFAELSEDGIIVKTIATNGRKIASKNYLMENALENVADAAISQDGELSISKKDGNVFRLTQEDEILVYEAAENDTGNFFSIAYEIEYDSKGNLLIDDIGKREIYRLEKESNQMDTVIDIGKTVNYEGMENFEDNPIYVGLSVSGTEDEVSVVSSEYIYDEELDDYLYNYHVYVENGDGELLYNDCVLKKTDSYLLKTGILLFLCVVLAVCVLIFVIFIIKMIPYMKLDTNVKIQFAILITAVAVTFFVSELIVDDYNERYMDEVVRGMTNISSMMGELLDEDDVNALNAPEDYGSESYQQIKYTVQKVLSDDTNKKSGMYCVLYKNVDGIICEVYSKYSHHGGLYPLAGGYEGSTEQEVYETQEPFISYDYNSADGNYMFVLSPVIDSQGNTIALMEVGIDLYEFTRANSDLMKSVLTFTVMAIVIVILLVIEIMYAVQAVKVRKKNRQEQTDYDASLIRPGVFLVFFAANMSTAFLPLYGGKLWTENFPFPSEVAAAIPLSVEMILAAVTAFLMGFFIERLGVKLVCITAIAFYVGGFAASAAAQNLWFLIVANGLLGIGGGMFTIAINTYISNYKEESQRNQGFLSLNAAYLSGANCGTVIGSLIAEYAGYKTVFYAGAAITVLAVVIAMFSIKKQKEVYSEDVQEGEKMSVLKYILSPDVLKYFLLINVPLIICASFLSYFFPIFGEENALTESQISLAFLLSGGISIYLGSALSNLAENKMKPKTAMLTAAVMYLAGLLFFARNTTILSCFIIIGVFAVADSFGMTMKLVYYTSLPEAKRIGDGKAMGINATVENIASALGPIVFGCGLLLGAKKGIALIGIVFAVLLVLFVVEMPRKGSKVVSRE
jgi:predicted MFS family arabinose efflux permease